MDGKKSVCANILYTVAIHYHSNDLLVAMVMAYDYQDPKNGGNHVT